MHKTWEEETSLMLKTINEETEKLLNSNLSIEEFHKKHQELTDYWHETSKKIQQNNNFQPKARPKHNHHTHHMTEKYHLKKVLKQFYQN